MNKRIMNIDFVKENNINKMKLIIDEWDADIWRNGCTKKSSSGRFFV